ncbi:DUF2569 family protein [Lutibacter sp. HS1-25]|uniref:DUF2569 family protein n=1 Tax=Lutibacter sp. HS1-25 TaxID=2485000 RepID=UPI0010121A61|nr:DUF2569 family protein [Lutibacter sp. HS1-25]RXP52354.1 DUF2569 family protein [Lutibacter sp. HS1-25]
MDKIEIKSMKEGIGGWLYLLCFLLIIGSPIRNLFVIYTEYTQTQLFFDEIKGLESYLYIMSTAILILMTMSIWSGILLLLIKPNAVKITKIYLILFLIHGIIQNFFPRIAGLDPYFINEMERQLMMNTISSILVFGIWFTYLNVSERVKITYPKSINNTNFKIHQILNFLTIPITKLVFKITSLKRVHNLDLKKLSYDEIIIISIIVSTALSLLLGYIFGETYYFYSDGRRGIKESHFYNEFHFNYLISFTSFIIIGGIIYIFLNQKVKNQN